MPGLSCGTQDLVPDQGLNLGSLHWEHGVLATGPPGKSFLLLHFNLINLINLCFSGLLITLSMTNAVSFRSISMLNDTHSRPQEISFGSVKSHLFLFKHVNTFRPFVGYRLNLWRVRQPSVSFLFPFVSVNKNVSDILAYSYPSCTSVFQSR